MYTLTEVGIGQPVNVLTSTPPAPGMGSGQPQTGDAGFLKFQHNSTHKPPNPKICTMAIQYRHIREGEISIYVLTHVHTHTLELG